jgi:hypothetical protein
MGSTFRIGRRVLLAATFAALILGAVAMPASAYTVIKQVGLLGEYYLDDTITTPAAKCVYGNEVVYSNWVWIKSFTVFAPVVRAADRNSNKRDKRRVSWQFQVQHARDPLLNWKVVKSSSIQYGTAYDDQAAPFTKMKVSYSPKFSLAEGQSGRFRPMIVIKWYKKDGSVEGRVKLIPSYYTFKSLYGTNNNAHDWCSTVATDG